MNIDTVEVQVMMVDLANVVDCLWGWACPPLRLHLAQHPRSSMGKIVTGERPPSPAHLAHISEKHLHGTLSECIMTSP